MRQIGFWVRDSFVSHACSFVVSSSYFAIGAISRTLPDGKHSNNN